MREQPSSQSKIDRTRAISSPARSWVDGVPLWSLQENAIRLDEPSRFLMIYSPPTRPVWTFPLTLDRRAEYVGGARYLIVDAETGEVRKVSVGE